MNILMKTVDSYTIKIIHSNRKSLALHVLPDATLVVKAPEHVSRRDIDKFITQHQDWIQERMEIIQKRSITPLTSQRQYKDGEEFLYLGNVHSLTIGNYKAISVKEDKILFPKFLEFRIKKELATWYIQQGKAIITERLEWYSKHMHLLYTGLSFADTKSRWGSCSHDNQLQFNWRLVMAPLLVINYVVVHELVHTQIKNHSPEFWRKVRSTNPSYRQQIKWLKENGEKLTL